MCHPMVTPSDERSSHHGRTITIPMTKDIMHIRRSKVTTIANSWKVHSISTTRLQPQWLLVTVSTIRTCERLQTTEAKIREKITHLYNFIMRKGLNQVDFLLVLL